MDLEETGKAQASDKYVKNIYQEIWRRWNRKFYEKAIMNIKKIPITAY